MVKEKACAKINLYLNVLAKRSDSYHDLEMVMAPIQLCDYLTFSKNAKGDITIITDKPITTEPQENIVYKIAEHMIKTYAVPTGVTITIKKNIPIAAGLGGGSADAAATLRGLNKLFKLNRSPEELAEIGEQFGSDIPYGIYNRLCIARGKGEQLFFLKRNLNLPVLIITPPFEVSTKKVYESVDMAKIPVNKITGITNAIYNKNYELIVRELYNALEPVTFALFDEVRRLKDEVQSFSVDGVLMSGSGPSMFVFHHDVKHLKELEEHFSQNHFTYLTKIK